MDNVDKKILQLLQKDAKMSCKHLAEVLFLSAPAIANRIERMEKSGIILGYTTNINLLELGYVITTFINLTMQPEKKEQFGSFIKENTNVLECYHVSGPYSMLIKVCFKSTEEMNSFISSLQFFGSTLTQIVFKEVDTSNLVL